MEAAAAEGERGVAMGAIVDALTGAGYRAEEVELAIWSLLGARLLTPSGFVCRMLQRRGEDERPRVSRSYELLLLPWSPADDRQLDLDLDRDRDRDRDDG